MAVEGTHVVEGAIFAAVFGLRDRETDFTAINSGHPLPPPPILGILGLQSFIQNSGLCGSFAIT
jgi:hypothetical protein